MITPNGRVTLLAAGRGGVGTSTVSLVLGLAAARRGQRALLVDGAEHTPALGPLLGIPGTPGGLGLVVRGAARPEELLIEIEEGLDLLPGGDPEPEMALQGGRGRLAGAYRAVSHLHSAYDCVFIDGGSRLSAIVAGVSAGVGRVGIVTTGDPVSLAGAYAVMKVLSTGKTRLRGGGLGVVLNHVGEGQDDDEVAVEHLREAADRFLGMDLEMVGRLPYDPDGLSALVEGRRDAFAASAIATAAADLLAPVPEEVSGSARKPLPTTPGAGAPSPSEQTPGPSLQVIK